MVSIRFMVSGPVSSILPSAQLWITPRGPNLRPEVRELLLRRVVILLGLLLGVEVVEVAEELVEAVVRRKKLVPVAEVVFAELPSGVALLLTGRRAKSFWLVMGRFQAVGAGRGW